MEGYMQRNNLEVYLGGLFGFVAIVAIIVELNLDGYVTRSLVTGVKDVSSLGVSVMLFIFTAKNLIPSINFEKRFRSNLDNWFSQMSPLVKRESSQSNWSNFIKKKFSGEKEDKYIRAFLSVDINKFYTSVTSSDDGEFLFLPEINQQNYSYKEGHPVILHFAMNKTTFLKNDIVSSNPDIGLKTLGDQICKKLESKYSTIKSDCYSESDKKVYIKLAIQQSFISEKEIRELFEIINYVLFLYAVAA